MAEALCLPKISGTGVSSEQICRASSEGQGLDRCAEHHRKEQCFSPALRRAFAALNPVFGVAAGPRRGRCHCPTPAPASLLRQQTAARLQDAARRVDGVVGYSIVDLTSGERFEWQPDVVLPTASTIKLAILYELAHAVDEGRLKLDDTRALDRKRAVPGGLLYEMGTPALSLRDYAVAMAVLSDNTATNVLIELLGMEAITARMRGLGLKDTRLRRYMIDLEAAKRGNENVSTPGDIARLLETFHRGTGLTPASRDEALTNPQEGEGPAERAGEGPAGRYRSGEQAGRTGRRARGRRDRLCEEPAVHLLRDDVVPAGRRSGRPGNRGVVAGGVRLLQQDGGRNGVREADREVRIDGRLQATAP